MFPDNTWQTAPPAELGFDPQSLATAGNWLHENASEQPYRALIVRHGKIAVEWNHRLKPGKLSPLASAAKSVYSCILAIAVAEGKINSYDDPVVDYYPEMMDVSEGRGPKPGRFAQPKDHAITFRQLISNTSGYMKPHEHPGKVYHYQTFGMNVLCHAIGKAYGLYDPNDPENSPGIGPMIQQRIGQPIGANLDYGYGNFDHPPEALTGIFGYYTSLYATPRDLARLGLLWMHLGRWNDQQLVSADWLKLATHTNSDIMNNCPADQRLYGCGFWTNDHALLWPNLPKDAFSANGAGKINVFCCKSLDLVVVQSPGIYEYQTENDQGLVGKIINAMTDL